MFADLSTTPVAARLYWLAATTLAGGDAEAAAVLLDGALELDPGFALARADRAVVRPGGPVPHADGSLHRWERAHLEVVATALAGRADRAAGLLREHLADVGCDPFATAACLAAVAGAPTCSDPLTELSVRARPPRRRRPRPS